MSTLDLTSHRLLRLCILLCTACSSMLSVLRISCLSLYMFGFAKRPSSAEKCDSNSSGDNWMPQIGQELWPVADCCIGFLGPIPGEREKKIVTHQLNFFARSLNQQHNYFFINFQTTEYDFCRSKKSRRPINAILSEAIVKTSAVVCHGRGFELF